MVAPRAGLAAILVRDQRSPEGRHGLRARSKSSRLADQEQIRKFIGSPLLHAKVVGRVAGDLHNHLITLTFLSNARSSITGIALVIP